MAGNRSTSIPTPPVTAGGEAAVPIKKHDPIGSLRARRGPIEVIALTAGFVAPKRIEKGERFTVSGPEKLGSWMKCVDPTIQKEHEHYCRDHKKKMQKLDKLPAGD